MSLKLCHFTTAILSSVTISILISFSCHFAYLKAQDDLDNPDTSELLFYKIAKHDNKNRTTLLITDINESEDYLNNATLKIRYRGKRQWNDCPNGCYSPCSNNGNCQQRYQLATVCVLGCCCPAPQTNLSSACDNDPAVAACLNGLCGQGYFCNSRNFCCRCQSGTSPGECVNNMCPAGYACNTNNYCCSIGSGSQLEQCVNGQCPISYACGAGNLCYPITGIGKIN